MPEQKHTPGPWGWLDEDFLELTSFSEDDPEFDGEDGGQVFTRVAEVGGQVFTRVAEVDFWAEGRERAANARLIASAPQMLSALEAVARSHLSDDADSPQAHPADRELIRLVREALALARGA